MKHITWTSTEERKVAIRAEEIRTNPELPENRLPTGQRCKSLASAYRFAQEVLEPARRKHQGTFFAGVAKLAGTHHAIMLQLKREEGHASVQAATKAADAEREREARTPPPPPADPLAPLKVLLGEMLAQAVAEGILRASAALGIQPAPADGNGNGSRVGVDVVAVAQALSQRTRRTPVDVVGLKGGQCTVVEKSPIAQAFDIRFIPAESHMRNRDVREEVVICSKFINHHTQQRYKAGNARLHFANGGPQSVIEQLERIVQSQAH